MKEPFVNGTAGSGEHAPACRYDIEIDMNSNSTHAIVVRLAGSGKRVLELGCSAGHMSRVLKERGCQVIGIDLDAVSAEKAALSCERVIIGDLDNMNLDREIGEDQFDVIIAADVLEHVKDPAAVLRAAKKFLKPDGYAVVSIPNIAHISVRLAVLSGRFPYADTGLLDRTHLRFFTRESVEKLFDDAGFAIGCLERIQNLPPDPLHFDVPYDPAAVPPAVLEALQSDPEALTYQFAIVAYPLPNGRLSYVQNRFKQLALEVGRLRTELAAGQLTVEQAGREREASLAEAAALRSEIDRIPGHLAALHTEKTALEERIGALSAEIQSQREEISRLHRHKVETESRLSILQSHAVRYQRRALELEELKDVSEKEAADARNNLQQQTLTLAGLRTQVEILSSREHDLRDMLLDAHDQLLRRDDEIAAMLGTAQSNRATPGRYGVYQHLIQRIREMIRDRVPEGSKVLVISKGDDQLLKLGNCAGAHFPQREDGVYAGHYPADDHAAVQHLKQLQEAGMNYLLIPHTALWWLEHYAGFAKYLKQYVRVVDQPDTCILFDFGNRQTLHSAPAKSERAFPERQFGVNVAAHLRSEKGVGEGARSTVRSLKAAGIPVELNDFTDFSSLNTDTEFAHVSDANPYSINLIHANADCLLEFAQWKTPSYFEGRYNIGFWAWELSQFPQQWSDGFRLLNEVWVPSTFALDSISRSSPVPVIAIPHSLRRLAISEKRDRSSFGLPRDKFLFLFMFDFMSIPQRKNPIGLIEAFKKAFKPRDKVMLVLKTSHADDYPVERRKLEQAAKGANIVLINEVLSREDTDSLLNLCDSYVSLHRSEGFGLTMAEAMSLGKPVIATGYSGNLDFMSSTNSFLVNYRLVELDQDYSPYPKGSVWAEPDSTHAAELMQHVYSNRKSACEIGIQAQKDVRNRLNDKAVGTLIRNRISLLASFGKLRAPERFDVSAKPQAPKRVDREYQRTVSQMKRLIEANTPAGSTVLVVSKGDDDLLDLKGRTGWHFPCQEDGVYSGYHPAHSAEAIHHLESLRAKGGRYLLFPKTSLWWLEHYAEFHQHLNRSHRKLKADSSGVLYELQAASVKPKKGVNGVHHPPAPRTREVSA